MGLGAAAVPAAVPAALQRLGMLQLGSGAWQ